MFDSGKNEMLVLPYGEKNYDNNMLNRFHPILERYGRTDGQTDRQTDGRTDIYTNIARQYADAR